MGIFEYYFNLYKATKSNLKASPLKGFHPIELELLSDREPRLYRTRSGHVGLVGQDA